jgi:hypothetical protein
MYTPRTSVEAIPSASLHHLAHQNHDFGQGAEAVPFIGFWWALSGLVKDDAMFSYVHGREFSLMVRLPRSLFSTRSLLL